MAERPFDDMQRRDAEFIESTLRLVNDAISAGREPPDFKKLHAIFYHLAKTTRKYWSKRGQKALATWKVEQFRREFAKEARKEWSKRGQRRWVTAKIEEFSRELLATDDNKTSEPPKEKSA